MTALAKWEQARQMLAEIRNTDDAMNTVDYAEAARVFAKQAKLGTEYVNHATAIKLKAERRLADMVDDGQAAGTIATPGGDTNVRPPDIALPGLPEPQRPATLDDLGVSRQRLHEARAIRDALPDDEAVDELVAEANAQPEPVEISRKEIVKGKVHVANNSGNNEWYTPPEYVAAAQDVFAHLWFDDECPRGDVDCDGCDCSAIQVDPASSDVAQRTVRAHTYYTAETNGLEQEWRGTVWMNPPYSGSLVGKFIDKLIHEFTAERVTAAIVLVNNATETAWAQKLLGFSSAVCFPAGRIKYHDATGKPANTPLQGQMFVFLAGQQWTCDMARVHAGNPSRLTPADMFAEHFSKFGVVVTS
jgi:ParB family chromosome partitioning protein